jgi:nicotinamidase-related amidase
MSNLDLNSERTALVAIDLQHGILTRQLGPHAAANVLANSVKLANAVRAKGGLVVWVRVELTAILHLPADSSTAPPKDSPPPSPSASELSAELGIQARDVIVTKRQWGAFYGTDLEQHLRRKGIRTVIMSGIATNFGVESTARGAFDRGYELVFAEDAMTSLSAEAHAFVVGNIFPRMGRVRATNDVVKALQEG